ncbi:FxSxx-COOH system tetratricopeptide repeat protein [Nonomuraea rhodomycinica]|uniref:Tetratricopeptide repeat protein n=1 Tax=Nonomuraea rhodomycinica TaxID=1712872 RepID=A0A7Y6IQX6_9ACTN|nr:FxSxx-COOH system tetratricopeptide repeat protein [Nonomuraea rhodomycinica]NUW42456.1 tetratricopeptide repeat protein [Nonomuraea rhodomycinica]
MTGSSPEKTPEGALVKRGRAQTLARAGAAVSLVSVGTGLVGFFFADPLHLPPEVLDVLDKRASVVSMAVGALLGGAALWMQLRALGPSADASPPTSSVAGSSVIDDHVSGGMVMAPAMTGDGAVAITGGFVGTVGGVHLPARPPVDTRPVQLAPRPPQLAGRDEVLADLHERLSAAEALPCLVAVHGLGGVCKTSVVAEYGHRYQHAYELVWQVAAEDEAVLSAAFADLAALLGLRPPGETADPVRQVHAALAARPCRWLLILDNAPDAEALRGFLPPAGNGHVLITSRSGHWPPKHGMELPILEAASATAFLLDRSGDHDEDAAAALVDELGALPLALEQAGAYISDSGITLAEYLGLLRDRRADLLDQGQAWGYEQRVASTWRLAFDRLTQTSPQAIALLRLLACYAPEAVPYRLLLAPTDRFNPQGLLDSGSDGITEPLALPHGDLAVNAAVTALRRYCLINRPVGGTVSVHRLVQAVTLDQLTPDQRDIWRCAAGALLTAVIPERPDEPGTWPRFAQLLPHARAVLPLSSPALFAMTQFLGFSGDYRTARTLCQQIHDSELTRLGPEHPQTLSVRCRLGRWTGQAGNAAAARNQLTALIPVVERVLGGEHSETLTARHDFAHWTGEAGDPAGARDQLAALLPVRERVLGAEHPDTLATRSQLAHWTGQAGNSITARDQFTVLLPVRERLLGAEHPETLITRSQLARWTGQAGDATAARDQFAALLPVRERVLGAEHPSTLATRHNLARWTGQAGDATAARDQLAAVLPVRERVLGAEHPSTLVTRHNLAYWTGKAGDAASARDQFATLLPLYERVMGAKHRHTLATRHQLAGWTGEAGDAATARDQFATLLLVRERLLGVEHPSCVANRHDLIYWSERARTWPGVHGS